VAANFWFVVFMLGFAFLRLGRVVQVEPVLIALGFSS